MNKFFDKLPFKKLAEKIPAGARTKVPVLDKIIPFANQIACGLAAVLLVVIITSAGGGSGGTVKGVGKNYTLSKASDFRYELTKIDGKDYVVIKGYNSPSKNFKATEVVEKPLGQPNETRIVDTMIIKIPQKIEGYTVGIVERNWAQSVQENIVAVTIPDSVIEIGDDAFANTSISSINLPKNLKKLGANSFSLCKNLGGSITIPSGVTLIPRGAFSSTKIKEVTIPNNVTVIGNYAFSTCSELTSVKLPSKVQYLHWSLNNKDYVTAEVLGTEWGLQPEEGANSAFSGCSKLNLTARNAIKATGYNGNF
jgi:hypothetical protein